MSLRAVIQAGPASERATPPLAGLDLPTLPEPTGERDQVDHAYAVVAVHVDVPQVGRVAGPSAQRAKEAPGVWQVHVLVAVAVAEEAMKGVVAVAARGAVAVAVECPTEAVLDRIRQDRERVTAVGQGATDHVRTDELEDGDRPPAD